MRFRLALMLALCMALLLLTTLSNDGLERARAQRAAAGGAKDEVIFAVMRRGDADFAFEPIAIYRRGNFVASITGESSPAELTRFGNSYYKAGQRYRLIWGGAEAGTVVTKESQQGSDCARAAATAAVHTSIRLGGNLMALATNSPKLGLAKSSRRAPTDAERAGVNEGVQKIFREKGVPADALDKVRTINLTATDLNADGAAELIGTFVVKRGAALLDRLFLIAEPTGTTFKVGHANYDLVKAEDLMSPESFESIGESAFLTEILLDQLDVDRDGTGEVFTIRYSFEGTNYAIYKKGGKGWTLIQEFYNYRCAF